MNQALIKLQSLLYVPNNIDFEYVEEERDHADYNAHVFKLNGKLAKFRVAKITPVKVGCFVAIWKRDVDGVSIPYDIVDPFDFYIIHVVNNEKSGQFIFPKQVLADNGVLSINSQGGKRGFRLYPVWDEPQSKQAKKTQQWQSPYFYMLQENKETFLPTGLF